MLLLSEPTSDDVDLYAHRYRVSFFALAVLRPIERKYLCKVRVPAKTIVQFIGCAPETTNVLFWNTLFP